MGKRKPPHVQSLRVAIVCEPGEIVELDRLANSVGMSRAKVAQLAMRLGLDAARKRVEGIAGSSTASE